MIIFIFEFFEREFQKHNPHFSKHIYSTVVKFNDHTRDYTLGAERFDADAAHQHLMHLMTVMQAFKYRRGVIAAAQAICAYVRFICRASEQASRYRWKLNMLRHKIWRDRVLEELGGEAALLRWDKQPPENQKVVRVKQRLFEWQKERREHMKRCAKACAHPRIFRDPCRLDQGGIFRLPPMRRVLTPAVRHSNVILHEYRYDARPVYKLPFFSTPITVWPDEFRAFADWTEEEAKEKEKEDALSRRVLWFSNHNQISFMCSHDTPSEAALSTVTQACKKLLVPP